MIARLGIGPALAGRIATDSSDLNFPPVACGYELVFNLASELKPVYGWRQLGLVPKAFQPPIVEMAGTSKRHDDDATHRLIQFLHGSASARPWRIAGWRDRA